MIKREHLPLVEKLVNKVDEYLLFLKENNYNINTYISLKGNILFHCSEELITTYIKKGVNPNSVNLFGRSILFMVSHKYVKDIIDLGANIDFQDNIGKTPLFYSDLKKTKELILNGADINIKSKLGDNALFYSDYNKSLFLLKSNIDLFCVNENGNSALFKTSIDKARLLVNSGIDVNLKNKKGETALFYSSYKIKEYLLENKANPNIIDKYGTPLLFNLTEKETKLFLKYNIDVNVVNSKEENCLFYCPLKKLKLLISNTNININKENEDGKHFLYTASIDVIFNLFEDKKIRKEIEKLLYTENKNNIFYIFDKVNNNYCLYAYLKNNFDYNILNKNKENLLFFLKYNNHSLYLLEQVNLNWELKNSNNENILFNFLDKKLFLKALNKGLDFFQKNNKGYYCFNNNFFKINHIQSFIENGGDVSLFKEGNKNLFDYILESEERIEELLKDEEVAYIIIKEFISKNLYSPLIKKLSSNLNFSIIYSKAEYEILKKNSNNNLLEEEKLNTLKNKRL